jgi:DNA (cytosine-5)-methyltransferase 1
VKQKMGGHLRYVDLFAGLGGFHVALNRLGHECVFASELCGPLQDTYKQNFGIQPVGDIRQVEPATIPEHDLLCAGFPCQPFSKAGEQQGLDCPDQGDLFSYVAAILKHHQPRYFFLENVPNLLRHDEGGTYALMKKTLRKLGYDVRETLLSPHQFGIPQVRERAYIVGSLDKMADFQWPAKQTDAKTSIKWALEKKPADSKPLSAESIDAINVWQRFLNLFPNEDALPSFPIWSMEFGATYPFEEETPHAIGLRRLSKFRGAHGQPLSSCTPDQRFLCLPAYARTQEDRFPDWKIQFIRQNRQLYLKNKKWIDRWLPDIKRFHASRQKLEWNCQGEKRDIWRYVLQFRASGIRVKRATTAPSLIAMTTTQVPIIAWERRYMTPRECARLQSLDSLKALPRSSSQAFKALGNAVNANVVEKIARALLPAAKARRKLNERPVARQ